MIGLLVCILLIPVVGFIFYLSCHKKEFWDYIKKK